MKISNEDKKRIESAVVEAELKTSGEIVPVILSKSDFYPAAHFRSALIVGVIFAVLFYYFEFLEDPIYIIWANIAGLIVGYFLAFVPFVKSLLCSKEEMSEEVHQRAIEAFYYNDVSKTRDRTGILIFISILERRVELLADCGINEKVSKDHWDQLVQKLLGRISKGESCDGIIEAIDECGKSLSSSFPIEKDDTNEVSNKLITDL